jgi:hypothetical protein
MATTFPRLVAVSVFTSCVSQSPSAFLQVFLIYLTIWDNTLIICNTYCFSTSTVVTRTRINITLKSAVFWGIMRRRVVIVYRRFGTTYRSHPHGSRVRVGKRITTRRRVNTPEDRRYHQHHGGSLKSRSILRYTYIACLVMIMVFWCIK